VRAAIRAGLALVAALALGYALTGNLWTLALLAFDVVLIVITWRLARTEHVRTRWGIAWIAVLVVVLVISKLATVQAYLGAAIWIGISYLIFRLIHVTIDARNGRLGDSTLPETLSYALHPTTLVAGPIDRVQHHTAEQRCQGEVAEPSKYVNDGVWRLFVGLFKKAALANVFYAFIAAHDMARQPDQPQGIAWLWLVAFSFYLYFDFAAYSDIAIGAGRLMGLRLPENFANPYMQPTIARFWQSWHMTLSTWLRDYVFFPLSRGLLKRYGSRFSAPILLISHVTTMVVCGLWHGLSTGFAAWGLWHGLGLFAYSQLPTLRRRFRLPILPAVLGIACTYGFVTLGWVFFSTDLRTAIRIFSRLFGIQ
jgi:alginate O-acetyltransferase complex protein AlgI